MSAVDTTTTAELKTDPIVREGIVIFKAVFGKSEFRSSSFGTAGVVEDAVVLSIRIAPSKVATLYSAAARNPEWLAIQRGFKVRLISDEEHKRWKEIEVDWEASLPDGGMINDTTVVYRGRGVGPAESR